MHTNIIRKIGLSLLIGTFACGMTVFANPKEEAYAKVITDQAALVNIPSPESINTRDLEKGEIIRVGDRIDNYTQVISEYGQVAYIESKYIDDVSEEKEVKQTTKEASKSNSSNGEEIVKFALQYVGNPYKYGGNSLTKGTDCSGFTSQVYKNFGINIQRTSGGQYASSGKSVKKSDLQQGDLIFYGYNGKVTHVAMYAGNNKIVHAGTAKTGIHVSPMEQRGMAPYMGAKRII